MEVYKKIFRYVPEKRVMALFAALFAVVSSIIITYGFYYIYNVLYALIIEDDLNMSVRYGIYAGILITSGVFSYFIAGVFSHLMAFRLETNLRKKGIDGLLNASFRFFEENQSGVIRRIIDDNAAKTHSAVAHLIPDVIQAITMPVFAIILGFIISLKTGLTLVVLSLVSFLIMGYMMTRESGFMEKYSNSLKKMSGETVEYIRGIQVVKIFRTDESSFKKLKDSIHEYGVFGYGYAKLCKMPYVLYQWVFFGVVLFLIIPLSFLLKNISDPKFFSIELISVLFLSGIISIYFMRIMFASQDIFEASYAINNLEDIYEKMFKDNLTFKDRSDFSNYSIEFKNVDFSYDKNPIFKDFSIKLEEGKIYALVGGSGSGKSTFAKLLSGFYRLDDGEILIGGKRIDDYSKEAIERAISFVFQDPKLFKTSIYENVRMAKKDATKEEVLNALHMAGCDDILDKFSTREDTIIGSKGVYLSVGEKQRIAIARAMLKDSKIVIMDEASASIDPDNEYELQKSFKNLIKGKTVIMIAHRLSSIRNVDEILVLKDGKVVERGSHEELIKNNFEYTTISKLYDKSNTWRVKDEKIS